MWIKLHFDEGAEHDDAYIQTENVCCVFTGYDNKTYVTFVGSDTHYFAVKESVDEVKKLLGIEIDEKEEKKE